MARSRKMAAPFGRTKTRSGRGRGGARIVGPVQVPQAGNSRKRSR